MITMAEPSGKFVVRIPRSLHARLRQFAFDHGISLNECSRRAIESYLEHTPGRPATYSREDEWIRLAAEVLGDQVVGMALFGSAARGTMGPGSDVDLLIVAESSIPLSRSLYSSWDRVSEDPVISPHFVHLPRSVAAAGSLWYEAAIDGIIIVEKDRRVSRFLQQVRSAIADRTIERADAYGHSYWIKRDTETMHVQ